MFFEITYENFLAMFKNSVETKLKKLKNKTLMTKKQKKNFLNIAKNISQKFEVFISKNVGRDIFLVKQSVFAVLVCASYKEPIVDFDLLYLKIYFEFL